MRSHPDPQQLEAALRRTASEIKGNKTPPKPAIDMRGFDPDLATDWSLLLPTTETLKRRFAHKPAQDKRIYDVFVQEEFEKGRNELLATRRLDGRHRRPASRTRAKNCCVRPCCGSAKSSAGAAASST